MKSWRRIFRDLSWSWSRWSWRCSTTRWWTRGLSFYLTFIRSRSFSSSRRRLVTWIAATGLTWTRSTAFVWSWPIASFAWSTRRSVAGPSAICRSRKRVHQNFKNMKRSKATYKIWKERIAGNRIRIFNWDKCLCSRRSRAHHFFAFIFNLLNLELLSLFSLELLILALFIFRPVLKS